MWKMADLANKQTEQIQEEQNQALAQVTAIMDQAFGASEAADTSIQSIPISFTNITESQNSEDSESESSDKSESEADDKSNPFTSFKIDENSFKCRSCKIVKTKNNAFNETDLCKDCNEYFKQQNEESKMKSLKTIYGGLTKKMEKNKKDIALTLKLHKLRMLNSASKWKKKKKVSFAQTDDVQVIGNDQNVEQQFLEYDVSNDQLKIADDENSDDEENKDKSDNDKSNKYYYKSDDVESDEDDSDESNNSENQDDDNMDATNFIISKLIMHSEDYKKKKFPQIAWTNDNKPNSINFALSHAYISTNGHWIACCLLGLNEDESTKSNVYVPTLNKMMSIRTVLLTPYIDDLHDTKVQKKNKSIIFPTKKPLKQELSDKDINTKFIEHQSDESKNVKRLKYQNIVQCLYQFILYPDKNDIMRLAVIISANNETFTIWFPRCGKSRKIYYSDPNYIQYSYSNRMDLDQPMKATNSNESKSNENEEDAANSEKIKFVKAKSKKKKSKSTENVEINADLFAQRFGNFDKQLINDELNKTMALQTIMPRLKQLLKNIPNLKPEDEEKFGDIMNGCQSSLGLMRG